MDKPLHLLFQEQARRTPEALAVADGERRLTYAQLDRESSQLAQHLCALGIEPDDTVGLYMQKSVDYVVGCLAALKAGGAFLPLFLDYPDSLMLKVVEQTEVKVVLTHRGLGTNFATKDRGHLLVIDEPLGATPELELPEVSIENLMFVVFSSGTTGEPKGIQLPHRAAVHSYAERHLFHAYKPGQRVACNIFFVWEIFRPLLHGASIHVISDEVIYDPKPLADFLEQHQITEVLFTPSLMETMLHQIPDHHWQSRFGSLEVIWLNGEVVTERLRERALQALPARVKLLNTYSISECHDVASSDLRRSAVSESGFCPVGYPIGGIDVRLMEADENGVGELYVGGPGLARGYLGKPVLTAERFVEVEEQRYYRTGDLAFQHPDGLLEIRGRCDSVVKIRGYSVHLGAVQSALESLPGIISAAPITVGQEGREKTLVAYLVAESEHDWRIDPRSATSSDLREMLRSKLSEFMLPNLFIEVKELPLNPVTGKLDRSLLPLPPRRQSQPVEDLSLEPEADPQQRTRVLAELFERLLGLEEGLVEPESDFFDLGGHSLLAVRLVQNIERIFATRVSVKQLYDYPTLEKLMHLIDNPEDQNESSANRPQPEEWRLPEQIAPAAAVSPTSVSKARGILVTGGTGFLGAFLLERLQRLTSAPIYCLVRPAGRSPQERLEQNLRSYGFEPGANLRAIAGDLSKPGMGIQADDYQKLVEQVEVIFHCAAMVNYVHGYSVLKPHTVGGTLEILKLACAGAGKTLHYISTNGIFPGGSTYYENRDIDAYLEPLEGGYGLAKWVAEKLVWQAVDRGLPVVMYRPGNIGHHSQSGKPNPNDFQYLLLRGCLKLGWAPDPDNWFFEMTPVDLLVEALVSFADCHQHFGEVYNVVQRPTTPARPFFDSLIENGILQGYLPRQQWIEKLDAEASRDGEQSLEVLANSLADVECYLSDTSVYDGTRFLAALAEHNLDPPEAGSDYLAMLAPSPQTAARS